MVVIIFGYIYLFMKKSFVYGYQKIIGKGSNVKAIINGFFSFLNVTFRQKLSYMYAKVKGRADG